MNIIVTIEDNALKDIDRIARSLTKLGMKVNQVMRITGIISGSIRNTSQAPSLKIKGVKSIEQSGKIFAS